MAVFKYLKYLNPWLKISRLASLTGMKHFSHFSVSLQYSWLLYKHKHKNPDSDSINKTPRFQPSCTPWHGMLPLFLAERKLARESKGERERKRNRGPFQYIPLGPVKHFGGSGAHTTDTYACTRSWLLEAPVFFTYTCVLEDPRMQASPYPTVG